MSATWRQAAAAAATAMMSVAGLLTALPAAAAGPAPTGSKTVYFTFDDGPAEGTAELLDATAAYDAKVSLFYVGRHGEESPELVARAAAEGHLIGSHTYSHRALTTLRDSEVREELIKARAALQPYVSNCWRPPGWRTSPAIEQAAKSLGMRQTLSVMDPAEKRTVFIPASWTDPDKIVSTVQQRVFDGAMVTLHAERSHNRPQLEAFKRLLPLLTADGYRFRTLPYCTRPTYKLLAVGDGVTSGTGTANYRSRLDALLRRGAEPHGLNYRWVGGVADRTAIGMNHDGHEDWTVDDVHRNIGDLQAAHEPDVILLSAGTLDSTRGRTATAVAGGMATLLRDIRRNQPHVKVFVSLPPRPGLGRSAAAVQNTALQRRMIDVIRSAGRGFYAVDLRDLDVAGRSERKIADRYYRSLRGNLPGSAAWAPAPDPDRVRG